MSFTIGETVGRYRITNQLGQGGMATVYRAYDANLDRYVAIKAMHQAFKEDDNFLSRFKREARIVAKLRHPHIVTIHEFDEHNGQPYLVMEHVEGETLKARLARRPFTMDETLQTLAAVGSALTYAHDQGVLHRDIKPSNILLDKRGIPYLTDFGLARMVQAGESTMSQDMMLGTPQYISPEQAQGLKELGPPTDIYSLGIVLYQLVVGRVPFSADTPYAIVHDHIYKPLPMPRQINPAVPASVERVLLKAGDRYQTANEMVAEFKRAVVTPTLDAAGEQIAPVIDPPPPTPEIPAVAPYSTVNPPAIGPVASLQRRRTLWMLGGLGAFVFTCLIALFFAISAISNPELRSDASALALSETTSTPLGSEIPMLSLEDALGQVQRRPNDPLAHFALAFAHLEADNRPRAQEALFRGMQLAQDDPATLAGAGQQLISQGYTFEAVHLLFQAAVELDSPAVRNSTGNILYQFATKASQRSIQLLQRVVENNPAYAVGPAILGRAYITVGQIQDAENNIDAALALNGALPETHLILGELYQVQGHLEEARTEWRYAITASETPLWVIARASELLDSNSGS